MRKILLDTRKSDENQLKTLLVSKLSSDFEIRPDVDGINLVENKPVKIDFLLRAKPHVVKDGFTQDWFGIEVKNIYRKGSPSSGKINELFWQALTYAQSKFDNQRLPFVLVLANDDYSTESDESDRQAFFLVARFCQYGNVGKLELEKTGYTICFDANLYYRKRNGIVQVGKTNAGLKRKVGNVS